MDYETPPDDQASPSDSSTGPQQPAQPYPPRQQANAYPGNQQGYPGNAAGNQGYASPPPPGAYPPPGYGGYAYAPVKPFSGKAIASAIIGGAMLLFMPIGIIGNIVGAILGFSALKDTNEHTGTHRGRGLAVGGIIGNIVMWLLSVGVVALFVFVFAMAATNMQQQNERHARDRVERQKREVDADLKLIQSRLNLYYIENESSLKPGGPIVNDGGSGGLYTEDHPRVLGSLKISDLVLQSDLENTLHSYKLTIKGDASAEIEYISTGRTLIVDDVAIMKWHFKGD